MKELSSSVRFLALAVPFLIWLWLHHWGNVDLQVDNRWYAHWITYHFEYLSKGVFPLWDPFRAWGWPDVYDTRFFGDLNPLYLIVSFLVLLHVPPFAAFNAFLVVFYLLGGIGFYLFVRSVWGRELPALVAYAMFMVSMIGELLFSQLTVMSMLFSSVWFFYFLSGYLKAQSPAKQKKYFAGLVFVMMLVVSTYVPFFFVVSASALVLAVVLLCPGVFGGFVKKSFAFAGAFPVLFWAGVASFIAACLPGLCFYLSTHHGDIVLLLERNAFGGSSSVAVPLGMISQSGLSAQVSLGEVFADQDFVMNTFCYVPVFLVILLSLGCLTRMDVRRRVILATALFIFLFALAGITPVHAFLYQHVGIFRLFRNLYFLGPLLMLTLAALGVGQLQAFLEARPDASWKRAWYLLFILLVHSGWMIVLLRQERVLWSSYATVAAGAVIFVLYGLEFFDRRKGLFLAGLLCLAMLQPGQLVMKYWSVWGTGTVNVHRQEAPSFAYTRPLRGQIPVMERGLGMAAKTSADESGFRPEGFYGTKYVHALYSNVPAGDLQKYVPYKFVVYDQVSYMDGERPDWDVLRRSLGGLQGPAWVYEKSALRPAAGEISGGQARPVSGPSDMFRVVAFDPNRVRFVTNFLARKFVVFNDSYYPGWAVSVNGKARPVYQANAAFKGVWVDAGRQDVEFRFGTIRQYAWHWGLVFLFAAWGWYAGYLLIRRKRCVVPGV